MEINFKQAEKYILSKGLLKFLNIEEPASSLEEEVFRIITNSYTTEVYDITFKEITHHQYRRRSITDIYRFVSYYQPNTPLEEVYSVLKKLISDEKITTWLCHTSKKRMYMPLCYSEYYPGFRGIPTDEYDYSYTAFYESLPSELKDLYKERYSYGATEIEKENYND